MYIKMSTAQTYQLADVHISAARGAKSAMLACKTGQVVFVASKACEAPFGATNFDRDVTAVRQNLELRLTKEQEAYFAEFDAWAVEYLSANSERLFKKQLTLAQVKETYHSPVKHSEKYDPLLRTKLTTSGNWATRFWDTEGKALAAPANLKGVRLIPRLHISHLWIMGTSCGFAVNVTDLRLEEVPVVECPFAM
jgi:hypothetical protein